MKNHFEIDGQLLQTNKCWAELKESQKQKISNWLREETAEYYKLHQAYPIGRSAEDVVDNVYEKIREADIWIPYGEVYKYYQGKKTYIINQLEKPRNMQKLYLDKTDPALACTSIISTEAMIVPAGTTMYAMPVSDKNEEYEKLADNKDIHFIFEDHVPAIDFYTIPHIDIFAYDSSGGFLGTVGEMTDLESAAQIIYIGYDHKCYVAGQSLKHLLSKGKNWRNNMKRWTKIQIFTSSEEAKAKLPFYNASDMK
ncbi:MAG: hypothetical protein Q4B73_06600 [Lachnospiraceae bacterium]|nr:hypothetical protein [Lachnospiraceae bacterium]